jgi:hypothetical protein
MKSEQFVEATKPLHWLLVNTPNLNESLYTPKPQNPE